MECPWKLKWKTEIFYTFFYTTHFLHSALSTLPFSTLHTPHFPHSSFSTLPICYTPHFLHSALSWSADGTNQNLGDNLRFGQETPAGLSVSLVSQWQRSIHLIRVINTLSHASFQFDSFFSRDQERENIDKSSFLSVFY